MLNLIIENDADKIRKQIAALKWQLMQDMPGKDRGIFEETVTVLENALCEVEKGGAS